MTNNDERRGPFRVQRSRHSRVTTITIGTWEWLQLQVGECGLSLTTGRLCVSLYWAKGWCFWGVSHYAIPDARLLRFDMITPIVAIFYLGWFPFPRRRR